MKQKTEDYNKSCRKVFNIYSINIWSNNINDIMFLYKTRVKLVKCGFCIILSIDFVKVLEVNCNLIVLGIQKKILLYS